MHASQVCYAPLDNHSLVNSVVMREERCLGSFERSRKIVVSGDSYREAAAGCWWVVGRRRTRGDGAKSHTYGFRFSMEKTPSCAGRTVLVCSQSCCSFSSCLDTARDVPTVDAAQWRACCAHCSTTRFPSNETG